jgi:hypothetical protein
LRLLCGDRDYARLLAAGSVIEAVRSTPLSHLVMAELRLVASSPPGLPALRRRASPSPAETHIYYV